MRKLMIVQWSGPLPEWIDEWRANTAWVSAQGHGWDFLLDNDEDSIRSRIEALGVTCPPLEGRKLCDYRPALGEMYVDELAGYDWFGHTDLDCVYGRLWDYVTDELLAESDIFSNDPAPWMCGPFSLYYRTREVEHVFRDHPDWRSVFESPEHVAFDERGIAPTIAASGLRVTHEHFEGEDSMYVHFAWSKTYPELDASFYEPLVAV